MSVQQIKNNSNLTFIFESIEFAFLEPNRVISINKLFKFSTTQPKSAWITRMIIVVIHQYNNRMSDVGEPNTQKRRLLSQQTTSCLMLHSNTAQITCVASCKAGCGMGYNASQAKLHGVLRLCC